MLPTFKDNPSKQFSQPNPAWGWGWPCCCAVATTRILVICTFVRQYIGAMVGTAVVSGTSSTGEHATVAALDGTTGSVLWYYDTGFSRPSVDNAAFYAGKTLIDNSGNIYIVCTGLGVSGLHTKLIKLDKNGNLLWTYDAGEAANNAGYTITTAPPGYLVAGIAFDSSGNIVFTRYVSDAVNFNYAHRVDTNGNLLQDYSTHGTGFGALADGSLISSGSHAGPSPAIALDGSNTLYWISNGSGGDHNRIIKVASAGTFDSQFAPTLSYTSGGDTTTGFMMDLIYDSVNTALYAGCSNTIGVGTNYVDTCKLLIKLSPNSGTVAPSESAAFLLNEINNHTLINLTSAGLTQLDFMNTVSPAYFACNSTVAYSPINNNVYFSSGQVADTSVPPQSLSNWLSTSDFTNPGIQTWESNAASDQVFGRGVAIDPTSGKLFVIVDATATHTGTVIQQDAAILSINENTSNIVNWRALRPIDSGHMIQPLTVAALTIPA